MFRKVANHKGKDKSYANFDPLHELIPCRNSNIDKDFKFLERSAQCGLYSLKTMVIEKEKLKLNTKVTANIKITRSIYNILNYFFS